MDPIGQPVKDSGTGRLLQSRTRPFFLAAGFLLLGLMTGQVLRFTVLPPPLAPPQSQQDLSELSILKQKTDDMELVKELCEHPDVWLEIDEEELGIGAEVASDLIRGAMSGSRGVGLQRIFLNNHEHRTIGIVFFGGALTGWPGISHGGAIATILLEHLDRIGRTCLSNDSRTKLGKSVDRVVLDYRKPVPANALYIIRAEVADLKGQEDGVYTVRATLEDVLYGTVFAEAVGKFAWTDS